ncbi:MAG: OmpH family outer membrane protein [Paludibacteraceae bacterium]|nr:OmpH family outer membrane protein [Paludibacteraceae bacterium]
MKKILIFLFWGAFSLAAFSQPKKVAVYVTGEDAGINKVFGSKLVSAFARSEQYSAVERTIEFLSQLSKEQNYQHSGAVDDSDLSRLGKQFGVQYVCVADVTDVYGEKYISARLINVETAEIVDAYDGGGRISSMSDCVRIANEIAGKLSPEEFAYTPIQYTSSRSTTLPNNGSKFGNCNLTEIYSAYIQKRYNGRDISEDESAKNYMQEQVKKAVESVTREYGLVGIFDDAAILYKGRDAKDITGLVMRKLNLQ